MMKVVMLRGGSEALLHKDLFIWRLFPPDKIGFSQSVSWLAYAVSRLHSKGREEGGVREGWRSED